MKCKGLSAAPAMKVASAARMMKYPAAREYYRMGVKQSGQLEDDEH